MLLSSSIALPISSSRDEEGGGEGGGEERQMYSTISTEVADFCLPSDQDKQTVR